MKCPVSASVSNKNMQAFMKLKLALQKSNKGESNIPASCS